MKVLSLFSGCGGMDIGFEGGFTCLRRSINTKLHPDWIEADDGTWVKLKKTGFETVFANDIRPDAKVAWVSYFQRRYPDANERYHLGSIVDLVKRVWTGEKVFPDTIDIVTGGFPCQDFSVAGKRLGLQSIKSHHGGDLHPDEATEENRGQLYIWMREVVSLAQPLLFIAENVRGLMNLGDVKAIMERDFADAADAGYLVIPASMMNAADYGVPQSRERVIFFGFKKSALTSEAEQALSQHPIPSAYDPYPIHTHAYTAQDAAMEKVVTCTEAFTGLMEPNETDDVSQMKYSRAKYMGRHCQGQKEVALDCPSPTIRSEHHGNIEFRRLSAKNGGMHFGELSQGLQQRRLTVRECARLQTFPDDYQFIHKRSEVSMGVNATNAYKIIGNAVPCLMAYHISQHLKENWRRYFGGAEE